MADLNSLHGFSHLARMAGPSGLLASLKGRVALAGQARPRGVNGPPLRYFLRELEALARPLRLGRGDIKIAPSPQPRLVMLLPGFATHPARMRRMERKLEEAGHSVKRWGQGVNLGPTTENFMALEQRVLSLHRRYDQKIVLVGWSLGGLFAREVAKRQPDAVEKVITMGSPFSGDAHANNVWRIYELVTGHSVDNPPVGKHRQIKPPVPTVALWSPRDGMIAARAACGKPGERDRAIALRCSHMGFAHSREAITAVLKELDRPG